MPGAGALDRLPPRRGDHLPPSIGRPSGSTIAAKQRLADRNPNDVAGSAHRVARFDRLGFVEQDATDAVALERLGEAELAAVEPHQFVEADVGQAGNQRDAVLDLSTLPIDLTFAPSSARSSRARAPSSQPSARRSKSSDMRRSPSSKAVEVGAPIVADEEMRATQLEAGDQRRIDGKADCRRRAERLGEEAAAHSSARPAGARR